MVEALIANFTMVGWFMIAAGLATIGSICSSIYKNVFKFDESFDWKKLLFGVIKGVIFLSSFFWFTAAATMIPLLIAEYGLVAEGVIDTLNVLICITVLVATSIKQLQKIYDNWIVCFSLTDEEVNTLKIERKINEM